MSDIYAVIYKHEHGTDVNLTRSLWRAKKFAAEIVSLWRNDFGISPEILNETAWEDWLNLTGGMEEIEIVATNFIEDRETQQVVEEALYEDAGFDPDLAYKDMLENGHFKEEEPEELTDPLSKGFQEGDNG